MTPEQLALIAEFRARLAKMSPAPWRPDCRHMSNPENRDDWPEDDFLQWEMEGMKEPWGRGVFVTGDAFGVALLRNRAGELLEMIETLEAENAALR